MVQGRLQQLLQVMRRATGARSVADLSDRELIERYVHEHDEAGFTEIMRRHGSLVYGVCKRILFDKNDADDAYQATFVVLAKRASSLDVRGPLAGWLYGVACRVAMRARTRATTRRNYERQAMTPNVTTDASPQEGWQELRPILDEELARLPNKYRQPLILCYLEGMTNDEAALELGWPRGSISRRLTRARELLRERLQNRGVALASGVLATLLTSQAAQGAVPAAVSAPALSAAMAFIRGGEHLAGFVSTSALELADGMLRSLVAARMRWLGGVAVISALALGGMAAFTYQSLSAHAAESRREVDKLTKTLRLVHLSPVVSAAFSADGSRLVTGGVDPVLQFWDTNKGRMTKQIVTLDVDVKNSMPTEYAVAITPDGKKALARSSEEQLRVWDVESGRELSPIGTVGHGRWFALSPNGELVAAPSESGVSLWNLRTGKEVTKIPAKGTFNVAFSADGKRLWMSGKDRRLRFIEVSTGKSIEPLPKINDCLAFSVAPDGRRVAVLTEDTLQVWDLDDSRLLGSFQQEGIELTAFAFGKDSKSLAVAGIRHETDKNMPFLWLWKVDANKRIEFPKGHDDSIVYIVFSPDGRTLATCGDDNLVRLWPLADVE